MKGQFGDKHRRRRVVERYDLRYVGGAQYSEQLNGWNYVIPDSRLDPPGFLHGRYVPTHLIEAEDTVEGVLRIQVTSERVEGEIILTLMSDTEVGLARTAHMDIYQSALRILRAWGTEHHIPLRIQRAWVTEHIPVPFLVIGLHSDTGNWLFFARGVFGAYVERDM